ncbi:MAG: hypothetical protein AAGA58_10265 [Verrucomicrobiota bacterium]
MKTVVLADTRWSGHHPTYFKEFTASLFRNDARVIALCPQPDEVREFVEAHCAEHIDHLHAVELQTRNKSILFPGRDHGPITTWLRWKTMSKTVKAAEQDTGWRADLVFFPYLDAWIRFLPFPSLPGKILGRPWSGLYFRCAHFGESLSKPAEFAKGDAILRSPDCVAVATLDEQFAEQLEKVSGKTVLPWPDITDETPPDPPSALSQEIAEKAAGRPIIGMVSMSKRKGLLTLLRIAEATRGKRDWFFAFAGPFHDDEMTADEKAFVHRLAAEQPDNLHLDLAAGRINDGRDFNSLINLFDIVWAAYENFQGSSNALTKAAVFNKPVIATKGGVIGERVEKFEIGETIAESSHPDGESAIDTVLNRTFDPTNSSSYHQLHNRERLDTLFDQLMVTTVE